jgi:DNA-binding MarR family transcriptional regulator
VVDRVLNPYGVLFNEDDLALAVDIDVTDANVYRSVVAAVANGARTATTVAQATGRKATSLVRHLDRLVAAGLLVRTPDPLRAKRARLDVGDPFLRFHFAIIRPNKHLIARGLGQEVWERSRAQFGSQVLGPHLEALGRAAMFDVGVPGLADVGATTVYDAAGRATIELDIAGVDGRDKVVVIGEAKATSRGVRDLERLERARDLVPVERRGGDVRLALVAPSFDAALRRVADSRPDVYLIDAEALAGHTT